MNELDKLIVNCIKGHKEGLTASEIVRQTKKSFLVIRSRLNYLENYGISKSYERRNGTIVTILQYKKEKATASKNPK